ncbi:hypothetical protein ACKWTF_000039 [Chironomus riparius]
MNYNNTPLGDLDLSRSQLAQNRRMRTKVVTKTESLEPRLNKNLEEKLKHKNLKAKFYYNKNVFPRENFLLAIKFGFNFKTILGKMEKLLLNVNSPDLMRFRLNKRSNMINLEERNSIGDDDSFIESFFDSLQPPQVPHATAATPQQNIVGPAIINQPQLRRSSRIPQPTKIYGLT